MSMNSRGYPRSSRNSNYQENNPNPNDNYYQSSRNYNTSREFTSGIFANQLNKNAKKKEPEVLELQIQEVPVYSGNKPKRNAVIRESSDFFRHSQAGSQEVESLIKHEIEGAKSQIYENVRQAIKEQGFKYDKALMELVTQINDALKKKDQNIFSTRLETNHLQQEFRKLASTFQTFSRENQQKLETLVNQVATLNGSKKSKAYGEYGVDLKNSFQGLNSSLSVNLGNDNSNSNSKLVNEVIYQLDSLKKDLNENKVQMEQMSLKLNSKIRESSVCEPSAKGDSFLKEEMMTQVEKRIREQRRSWKIDEKFDGIEGKILSLHEILQKQEQNIFGMNEQLKNTLNNQMNPKIKKIESSLVDIYTKIDPLIFDNQIREGIARQIEAKLDECKVVKVRNCTKKESTRINSITGMNDDKITFKQTYLLDEENYLLDSEGNYLVQEINNQRARVRLQENMIYLLRLKGMEVA